MNLKPPFEISSRLMVSVKVGNAVVSGEVPGFAGDRAVYVFHIDLPDKKTFKVDDIKSGMIGRKFDEAKELQQGFASLFAFLGAALESRKYRQWKGGTEVDADSNENLFEPEVLDWAENHTDEIASLGCQLEEEKGLLTEDD